MSTGTVTRADLAEAVYREIGLSRSESSELVESVIDHVSEALLRGEQVKLAGFGTFSLRDKKERMGRNPKTGKAVPITPRRVLVFKPSQILRERVDSALTRK
ncbi:integration host factor subunit alpha [Hellea sp.]|nr:integration host factor subunit alpha [Hellea sp.]